MGVVCYLQERSLAQMPSLGSRLIVCGKVRYFANAENEGQFDARAYYASLGYDIQLTNAEILKVSREADRLAEGLFRLREDAVSAEWDRTYSGNLRAAYLVAWYGILQAAA